MAEVASFQINTLKHHRWPGQHSQYTDLLDSPRFKTQLQQDFCIHPDQPQSPPVQWVLAPNPHSNAAWVWLTTHPQLVQRLKKQYSYASPLTPLSSSDFMACYRVNFTFKTSQMFRPSGKGKKMHALCCFS